MQFGPSSVKYKKVLSLVVESGAIYSSALVIEIALYFVKTNGFYIVYDPIAQLTVRGIFFPWFCANQKFIHRQLYPL